MAWTSLPWTHLKRPRLQLPSSLSFKPFATAESPDWQTPAAGRRGLPQEFQSIHYAISGAHLRGSEDTSVLYFWRDLAFDEVLHQGEGFVP